MNPVPVRLDLRECARPLRAPDDYVSLWNRVEPALEGLPLIDGRSQRVDLQDDGAAVVLVLRTVATGAVADSTTTFVIRGVIETPEIRHRCSTCADDGREVYGPFICAGCKDDGRPGRVCDDHVAVLDLNFTQVTCLRHVPRCSCGREAEFWCRGRACQGRTAWCGAHRHAHPGDASIGLCPKCRTEDFPQCTTHGCRHTGSLRCEFTRDDLRACRSAVCPDHAIRWQVFGPKRSGLVLCRDHSACLRDLQPDVVVRQVLVGATRRAGARASVQLPSMATLRHVLIKTRRQVFRLRQIDLLTRRPVDAAVGGTIATRLRTALDRERSTWDREVSGEDEGADIMERLRRLLHADGRSEHAQEIGFSSFNARTRLLFVALPANLIGAFKGRQGSNVGRYEQQLGVTIRVEKPQ